MNILTDCLPEWIEADGSRLRVRTDFRIWIEFDRIMHQRELAPKEKFSIISALCIEDKNLPCDLLPDSIIEGLCNFYLCGAKAEKQMQEKQTPPVFSFCEDSGYVFAAFLSSYGIDLLSIPYMHWFVFSALLKGLDDSTRLMKIMSWRASRPEKEKNPQRREFLRRMQELYALADKRTKEEKDRDIADALSELL